MRQLAKSIVNGICVVIVLPCTLSCKLETKVTGAESLFLFWAHVLSILPGRPGAFLRRAYYRATLHVAEGNFFVGFGAMFTHRNAEIHNDVYIGPYALIGCANLGEGTLVGSRASMLSGTNQHELAEDGTWKPFDAERVRQIQIGRNVWIGEGAIVMADVGDGAMIAAGSVVATKVKAGVSVAGNPARFVRKLEVPAADAAKNDDPQRPTPTENSDESDSPAAPATVSAEESA